MPHWKLTLAYDGTDFHGWQVQPRRPTIQGALADALEHITGERVLPQGSGRTDAGVHALGQVASFTLEAPIPPANLLRAANRALPPAIRVLRAEQVPASFHARYDARRKTYEYRIFPGADRGRSDRAHPDPGRPAEERVCSPFVARFAWDCPWPIDPGLARAAASALLGEHDFTSFAAVDPELRNGERAAPPNAVRTLFESHWHEQDGLHVYRVSGSGFLHHMVRNLLGTLVEVASGRLALEQIATILAARDRSAAGPTAPAQGLFLVEVEYPAPAESPAESSAGYPSESLAEAQP